MGMGSYPVARSTGQGLFVFNNKLISFHCGGHGVGDYICCMLGLVYGLGGIGGIYTCSGRCVHGQILSDKGNKGVRVSCDGFGRL